MESPVQSLHARDPGLHFDVSVPRWWFHSNPVLTHVANGLHLVFPEGERFFCRSVAHYLDQLQDPALKERAKGFFAQEVKHGAEHTRSFKMLEQQGYDVRSFLDFYEKTAPKIEAMFPPNLRLSVTVALEHMTATLAEMALTDKFLDGAHEQMARLLRWHAAEEIEHKAVAFDVLAEVDPRYWVRAAGMFLGLAFLFTFWGIGTQKLMRQEKLERGAFRQFRRQAQAMRKHRLRNAVVKAVVEYLRPGFHPNQNDNWALARNYLAAEGLA